MTPAARISASIDILDSLLAGVPAEKCLTNWARKNRFAGSGDRAAIRNIVYDILRKKRSCMAYGGGQDGRALAIGYLRQSGQDETAVFCAQGYAPDVLSPTEAAYEPDVKNMPEAARLDYPDWLEGQLRASLQGEFHQIMERMRVRAPLFLRVNKRRGTMAQAVEMLKGEQIETSKHDLAEFALEVSQNPRRVAANQAYLTGLVEIQDVASQAIVVELDVPQQGNILDYCAGGGGKSLAIAAISNAKIFAHDAIAARLRDLPPRADRSGVDIKVLDTKAIKTHAPYNFVLCDVPCSGSGAWRRNPAAKWDLTPDGLAALCKLQMEILLQAADFVAIGGTLAYVTCSLFAIENQDQITDFLQKNPHFENVSARFFSPLEGGDGLFVANLKRVA